MSRKNIFVQVFEFALKNKKPSLTKLKDEEEYLTPFIDDITENARLKAAHQHAWDARKFEIDNYWKRTTYFWAFQITAFAGYFSILNSDTYNSIPAKNPEVLFCSISFGFITAMSWTLINIGSKFWQRHWEKHIDMLEDKITGPLYKTVYAYKTTKTYSVSKINDIISRYFVIIWIVFAIKYGFEHITLSGEYSKIAYIEILVLLFSLYFTLAMFRGHGRGSFGAAEFAFYRRTVFKEQKGNFPTDDTK